MTSRSASGSLPAHFCRQAYDVIFLGRRRLGWNNYGRDFLLPQPLLENVDGYSMEEVGRLPDVRRPDFRELSRHAIDGLVGQFIRNAHPAALENLDQPFSDDFIFNRGLFPIPIQPLEQLIKPLLI